MGQTESLKTLETKLKAKIAALHKLHRNGHATLADALMIYPEELEASYTLGLQLLGSKKYKEAAQLFASLCLMSNYDGRFWRMCGFAMQKIERPALALLAFEMALVILPDDIPTLTYRGEIQILLGRRVEAQRDLDAVLRKGNLQSSADAPFVKRAQGLIRYARPDAGAST